MSNRADPRQPGDVHDGGAPTARDFDEFDFYAPFGRYEGSRSAPAPRHAFLVGRGRERAHFLDLLYMKSGLGSYLITGVRGVGKTSFVRHCLDTYTRDVYERYCRSQVGRSVLDKACAFVALAIPSFFLLTLSPLVHGFLHGGARGALANLLLGTLAAAVALVCASPLIWAYRTRRSLFAHRTRTWASTCAWAGLAALPFLFNAAMASSEAGFWLIAVEGVSLLCLVAWRMPGRHDGWEHSQPKREQLLKRAIGVGTARLLSMASLSAGLIGALARPLASWAHELSAIAACSVIVPALIYFEKLWLLQPSRRMVFETAIHPVGDVGAGSSEIDESERIARSVEDTLFYSLFRRWLPVMRVGINLGLDRLTHRHIIESMLRGLHAQLRATFGGRLRIFNLQRYVLVAGLWLAVLHVGRASTREVLQALSKREAAAEHADVKPRAARPNASTASTMTAEALIARIWSCLPKLDQPSSRETRLANLLLPPRIDLFSGALLWVALWLSSRWLVRPPHDRARREIGALLDSLASRVTVESKSVEGKLAVPGQGVAELTMPTRQRKVETDPQDPRSLEQAFLGILEQIRKPTRKLVHGLALSLPAPEAIFVFDELDKVGTTTSLLDASGESSHPHVRDVERDRSRKLQALLSDLKNLLGTAQARFVFVGGRNLHDEWLADEVNRQPLLSNIFDAELYLRTLLTDNTEGDASFSTDPARGETSQRARSVCGQRPLGSHGRLTQSVQRYFEAQHLRVRHTWQQWRTSAGAGHREYDLQVLPPAFERGSAGVDRQPLTHEFPELRVVRDGSPLVLPQFWPAFICFLTFRSRGIPRRARLILEAFVRPYDRVAPNDLRRGDRESQHVLYFDHGDRLRIELVSEIFRAIDRSPSSLEWRDDKVLMAVFQFADFLTRFHRRAFSLQSLERFEELMHVHRAPDTGMLAARLISDWLGTLLETTAAGIHTYRFRLEWAAEIANLSGLSQHESASANFSLDEAQALKSELQAMLNQVNGTGGAFEVHTALAELHDLDGDHLDARHHFRKAIEILDARLKQEFVEGGQAGKGAVALVLGAPKDDERNSGGPMERQLDWALARLRVILQLGLTYERTFDYERAGLEYGDALQVARAIWSSRGKLRATLKSSATALLEPIFAQAWAALKDPVVTQSPFDAAHDWLSQLLWGAPLPQGTREERWSDTAKRAKRPAQESLRELNMLGDLAFFAIPRWRNQLDDAVEAYELASKIAAGRERELEQQARSAFSLALCELAGHRFEPRLELERIRRFVHFMHQAQMFAVHAPSSQGPFADSMAIHHIGLELVEELWQLARRCSPPVDRRAFSSCVECLLKPPPSSARLSPLRERMLDDACWRLRDLRPEWSSKVPCPGAFPARNRFLNFRSACNGIPSDPTLQRLLRMWRRFDNRATLAPCRIAVAAPRSPEVRDLWQESRDICEAGKHYFAWVRDRYYLDDGFGPMLLRANFAITLGFDGVHRGLQDQ